MKRRDFIACLTIATAGATILPGIISNKPVEFEFDGHDFLFHETDWIRLVSQAARVKHFHIRRDDGQGFYAVIAIPDNEWFAHENLYPELKNEALLQLWDLYKNFKKVAA